MSKNTQRATKGQHRKVITSQTAKGRLALVAVAAGTVSVAGAGGAGAATLQAQDQNEAPAAAADAVDYELTGDAVSLSSTSSKSADLAPQILAIAEYKPVANLDSQLDKAVAAVEETRAAEAAAAEAAAIEQGLTAALSPGSVVKPAEGTFTSGFGPRWGTMHNGIDIANAVGTPILAVMDGTVISSGPASGYGNWIRIQHDDGAVSIYGHMVSLDVSVGERVTAGQKIAGMGNEGFSTGSHLHFEIHPNGSTPVDPQPWLAQHGITL